MSPVFVTPFTVVPPEPPTPMPTVSTVAQRLYDAMYPLTVPDADQAPAWPLLHWCQAVSAPVAEVDSLAADPGAWSDLLNPSTCPAKALTYLGQLVGVTVPSGSPEAAARGLVRARTGWGRGQPATIRAAAQIWLQGTRQVTINERTTSAYALEVQVYEAEVVDLARLTAAVNSAVPAGLVCTITVLPGRTYAEAEADHAGESYSVAEASVAPITYAAEERKVP